MGHPHESLRSLADGFSQRDIEAPKEEQAPVVVSEITPVLKPVIELEPAERETAEVHCRRTSGRGSYNVYA